MKQYGRDGNVYDININNTSELELKPIPNIVNVDDIQSIIDTNKILQEKHDILKHTLEANIEHQKKLKEENKQLKSIIKEAREFIKKEQQHYQRRDVYINANDFLEILDKVEVKNNGKD